MSSQIKHSPGNPGRFRTAIPFEGERHNALDDARYQAKYVSVIWQKLIPSQADS
ncbi:endodeoxyribonuclease [Escherichia coli]|nr:endodeoxyribonuclease [Escherichia coli]